MSERTVSRKLQCIPWPRKEMTMLELESGKKRADQRDVSVLFVVQETAKAGDGAKHENGDFGEHVLLSRG